MKDNRTVLKEYRSGLLPINTLKLQIVCRLQIG
jgi:hypothetical protein